MSVERLKIRRAFVALLKRQRTTVGENVFDSRSIPNWDEKLPAINVYTLGETVEEYAVSPLEYKRTVTVMVEALASESTEEDCAEKLDVICDEIENILHVDDSLGGLVEAIRLVNIDINFEQGGEKPAGAARMTYNAIYLKAAPETAKDQKLVDLKTVNIDWDVGTATDPDPEATDVVNY